MHTPKKEKGTQRHIRSMLKAQPPITEKKINKKHKKIAQNAAPFNFSDEQFFERNPASRARREALRVAIRPLIISFLFRISFFFFKSFCFVFFFAG